MMQKKRQYYGFTNFHFPSIPKAPRSARGRVHTKKVEDSQICAFELLASLAGRLLQESESSSASTNASETNDQPAISDDVIKQEQQEQQLLKTECPDQGSCEESVFIPQFMLTNGDQKFKKESPHAESDSTLEPSSIVMNSESSEKVNNDVKSLLYKSNNFCGSSPVKVEGGSPNSRDFCDSHVENNFIRQRGANERETGGLTINNTSSSNDPKELCMKFPELVNSDNNVKSPSRRDSIPNASLLRHRNNVKLGNRDDDDDENFSRCTKPKKNKAFRPPRRIVDRRMRKLLTSKYWKVAPKLKDCELPKVDGGMKPLYSKRKMCYSRARHQQDTIFKRRKLSDRSLVLISDGGFNGESVCNSSVKGVNDNSKNYSAAMFHGANGISSSVIGRQASFHSKDSHVRLSIKSFKVPELFIEVPENATVGMLKRTVMDAVTAILEGGLRVGMVLHGKKVRDDNRTLLQTGIASKENLDTLGFTLEPNPVQAPSPVCTEESPVVLAQNDTPQPISRSRATPVIDSRICNTASPDSLPLTNSSNNDPISSLTDMITDQPPSDSKALVPVPPVNAEALALVPMNQKSKRSELAQRRTRRPFSVAEVEALVQAVEELGTGRWRDVKLRSFENADHRTYVDLKDKWKTLVHTAKIAPQQRRGEPVPQELLDRVLTAHAYWSQNQAKQHSKNQSTILKITEAYPLKSEGTQM